MNFALLWIDALIVALLWVAATVAITSRFRRQWLRVALLLIVIGPPLAVLATFAYGVSMIQFTTPTRPSWFGYALSLLVAFLIGGGLILRRARRRNPGQAPAAAGWSLLPLIAALLIVIGVGYMALLNMDLAIRARCAILSLKAGQEYWAAAPAVVSESDNAAPLYEKAFSRLRADMGQDVNNPPIGNNETFDPNEPATISFLHRQAGTIKLLRKAAALPACRFDIDLSNSSIKGILPDLNFERESANVLWLHAKEELAHGNVTSAIADAQAVKQMSRQFGQRPLVVSALVGFGIDAVGNAMLAEALPKVSDPTQLMSLHMDELPSMGRMYQQSLRGEEQFGLAYYANMPHWQHMQSNVDSMNLSPTSAGGAYMRVFFLDLDEYLAMMSRLEHAATQPYYAVRDQLVKGYGGSDARSGLFTRILAPSLSRGLETFARVEAGDACAHVAVAATRYRLDHGKLPAQLSELTPKYLKEIPLDPFDGKPLHLATRKDHWIVYSVGPDRTDNGGAEMEHGKGDLTFTLRIGDK